MLFRKCHLTPIIFSLLLACSINANAKNGIYLTLETGVGRQSGLPNPSEAHALNSTPDFPSAYRIAIGYNHDFCCCFGIGLDLGMGRYGDEIYVYPSNKTHVRSETLEFLALAEWHIKQWDIIGKIGGIRQTLIITGFDSQDNQTQIAPEVSGGIAYNFTSSLAMIASYAHVFGDQINSFNETHNKNPSLSQVLIGLRYSFGSS